MFTCYHLINDEYLIVTDADYWDVMIDDVGNKYIMIRDIMYKYNGVYVL